MTKNVLFLFTFLVFVGICAVSAQNQNKWRNYLDPRPSDFVQSGDYIWLASQGGLIQYNTLTKAHRIFQPDTCAIKGVNILSLCSDSVGGVWFSTNAGGLQHFDGTTFRWFPNHTNGAILSAIRKIQLDKQGRLWMLHFTNSYGALDLGEILMFNQQEWKNYMRDSLDYEADFAVDKDGVCWGYQQVYSPRFYKSIVAFDSRNGQFSHFDTLNSPLKIKMYGAPLFKTDRVGHVWLTYDSPDDTNMYLHQLGVTGWKTFRKSLNRANFESYRPSEIIVDKSGVIHLLLGYGFYIFKDSTFSYKQERNYTTSRFLPIDSLKSWRIANDFSQALPYDFCLLDNGVRQPISFTSGQSLLLRSRGYEVFGNYPQSNSLLIGSFEFDGRQFKPNNIYGTQAAFEGDSLLWLSGYNNIAYYDFRTKLGRSILEPRILPSKVRVDKFGNKWILAFSGVALKGLYKVALDKTVSFSKWSDDNSLGTHIYDFDVDTMGTVWAANDSGLVKRNPQTGVWSLVPLPDSVKRFIDAINIDEGNHIWLSYGGFFVQYSTQNGLKIFGYQDIVFRQSIGSEYMYSNFVSYRSGVWWLITDYGLTRYDGVNFQKFSAVNSLIPTKNVFSVFTDKLNNLWINHYYGLTVYNENGIVDLRTSLKEAPQQAELPHQFFPNPLSNQGILTFQNPQNALFTLRIFNINGQIIAQQETRSSQFLIQNNDWANGIYLYQIESEGKKGYGKFVVQL